MSFNMPSLVAKFVRSAFVAYSTWPSAIMNYFPCPGEPCAEQVGACEPAVPMCFGPVSGRRNIWSVLSAAADIFFVVVIVYSSIAALHSYYVLGQFWLMQLVYGYIVILFAHIVAPVWSK
ncbi:hypothetical protein FKM82_018008 [Ascaphus truei]